MVQEAEYLRSYATQAGTDIRYVGGRISKASQAFGAPKRCLFRGQAQCVLTGWLLYGAEHRRHWPSAFFSRKKEVGAEHHLRGFYFSQ